jgi:hypothetical protein
MTAAAHKILIEVLPGTTVRTYQRLVLAGELIYEGATVAADPATGKWVEASANPTFEVYGVARCADSFDNTAGTNTAEMLVDSGTFLRISSGLTDADEGKTVYVSDDQTFVVAPAALKPVMGKLVLVKDSTHGFVEMGPASAHINAIVSKGADLTDAAATILITQGSWRTLPAATLTTARALTLGTTGAYLGCPMIHITRLDATANVYTITNGGAGGGNPAVFPVSKTGSADFYFDGTNWLFYGGGTGLT